MKTCSDCKERERAWGFTASSGHCENDWCENFIPTYVIQNNIVLVDLDQPLERQAFVKSWLKKNQRQPKITYFFQRKI